jgi:predicted NBD/HSP70 family sugar kinase
VKRGLAEAGVGSVAAAGVGTPGLVARDGRVTISVLPQWSGLELAAAVGRLVDCPVAAENDANLAVLAERWQGVARADDDVVLVLLEQGIGAGVLLGGRLHRGHHGAAGEIAFGDFLGGLPALRGLGHDVVEAALRGEEPANAAIAAAAPHIARHVTALVLAYDPALVVLGGGVTGSGEQLLGPVRERVRADAMKPAGGAADIVLAALGDHVGVVGAAAIVYDRAATGGLLLHG